LKKLVTAADQAAPRSPCLLPGAPPEFLIVRRPLPLPDRAAQVVAAVIFNLRPPSSISLCAASRALSFPLKVSRQGEDSLEPLFVCPRPPCHLRALAGVRSTAAVRPSSR
jgi:hypothetical protein